MKQIVSVSTAAINRVNCTKAPICSTLNRFQCATKDHTCGSCFSGYIGEDGESNSLCVSGTFSAQIFARFDLQNGCGTFKDCMEWEYCENKVAKLNQKSVLKIAITMELVIILV